MTPIMPYKLTWCRQLATVSDYCLPVTLRGLLWVRLWDNLLRPLAKQTFSRLPTGLRQRLVKVLRR
jgi:hypothetical protein